MATVQSYTKEYMDPILDAVVVGTHLDEAELILEHQDGSETSGGDFGTAINDMIDAALAAILPAALLALHPVGCIYTSVDNTDPGTLFGGTWAAFGSGRVPIGVNAADSRFDVAEETGGTDTIAANMLPVHTHPIGGSSGTEAAHTHGITGSTGTVSADHTHGVSITSGINSANHVHNQSTLLKTNNAAGSGASDNGGDSVVQGTTAGRFTGGQSGATSGINVNHTHAVVGNTGGISANHTHTLPANTNVGSSHSHSLPAATGNSATPSATLLPPYIAVYMWKRTA